MIGKQLREPGPEIPGHCFDLVVNAVGVHACGRLRDESSREFERKRTPLGQNVFVLPRPEHPEVEQPVRVVDQSLGGFRVRANATIESMADGDAICFRTEHGFLECERRWCRRREAGFEVRRQLAAPGAGPAEATAAHEP